MRKSLLSAALAAWCAAVCGLLQPAQAATIVEGLWNGAPALLLHGEIVPGDRDRLAEALAAREARPHGAILLLLNSPGGSVSEAMAISDLLEEYRVHTVVPDGAECASACASIVFISGRYRTVEWGGLIGQHTCSVDGFALEACNETIAQHAIGHGVSHGSIAAFMTFVPPDEILWFNREQVDCYGLTFYPLEDVTGFGRSEPCVFRIITDREPEPQTTWRVDVLDTGYRAFSRVVADNLREGAISFYCRNPDAPRYFISLEIGGPAEVIQGAIQHGTLTGPGLGAQTRPVTVEQVDAVYSRANIEISATEAQGILATPGPLRVHFSLSAPYTDIMSPTETEGSHAALAFAADHCARAAP